MRIKGFLKDAGFVISSNFLTLAVSSIVILVVPRIIGVTEYGYWQLFMFYSGYLGIFPLGWLDGIYLRYGGEIYENLNKSLFKSQFTLLMLLQTVFAFTMVSIAIIINNEQYSFILISLAAFLLIYVALSFCKFILQITNRLPEYSTVTILSNFIYVVLVIGLIVVNVRDFRTLIIAFIFGNFIALIYAIYTLKDIFCEKYTKGDFMPLHEAYLNIKVGSQLLIANVAAMLIIGVVRIGIQHGWCVAEFGKVSLTLSISNLLMVFINAISLIIFPKLKRIPQNKVHNLYSVIRNTLMPVVFIGMLIYFPLNYLIPLWLPKYASGLIYMSALFPMVVYQAKIELLSNTFMKALRMEHQLLVINVITLIVSVFLTSISVFGLHNLSTSVFVIIIVMGLRSTISEIYISNALHLKFSLEIIIETFVIVGFILLSWYLPKMESFIGYIMILAIYFLIKRKDIIRAIIQIKLL